MTTLERWWHILHGSHHAHRLSRPECLALLELGHVGRLAYATPTGPQIVLTGYVCLGDQVFLPAELADRAGPQLDGQAVAFEVDRLDPVQGGGWSGWSLRATGTASLAAASQFWLGLAEALGPVHPWGPTLMGPSGETLACIEIDTVAGDQLDSRPTDERSTSGHRRSGTARPHAGTFGTYPAPVPGRTVEAGLSAIRHGR